MAPFIEADAVSITAHSPQRLTSLDSKETEQLQQPLHRASNLRELIELIDREVIGAVEQLIEDFPEEAAKSNWMCL